MEIIQNKFAFFANFAEAFQELPDDKRPQAYQAICEYAIYGILPDDESLGMMCLMVKASLFKEDGRKNNGGNHNPTGKNQHSDDLTKIDKEVNSGQSWSKLVNSGQFLSETETETRNKKSKEKIIKKKNEIDWDFVKARWNEIAKKWGRPMLRGLTPQRKQSFEARLKDYEGPVEILMDEIDYRLRTSLILRGKQMNKDGEVENADWGGADFDFVCRPTKFFRIIEGGYGDADLVRAYEKQKQIALEMQGSVDEN